MDKPNPAELVGRADMTAVALVDHAIFYLEGAKARLQPKTVLTPGRQFVHFIKHFGDNPVKNTMLTLSAVLFVALMGWTVVVISREQRAKEMLRRESLSYVAQSQALDNVKSSLKSLLDFVQSQKTNCRNRKIL